VVLPEQAAPSSSLALVQQLSEALQAEAIAYCHWKSNAFLDRSRRGENDLDLLVRRADIEAFAAVVHGVGFKKATNPSGSLPGVEDYYGYDRPSDQIVHVHAHYQLIVGDDLTKNYCIPLENAFLEMTLWDGELRIPIPELELILLVIRLTLKHSTWDALLARRAKLPASALQELVFLRARADEELVHALLKEQLPFVEWPAFEAALGSLERAEGTRARIRAGRRLVDQLAVCARRSRAADIRLKLWRRVVGTARARLPLATPRKQLAGGGAIIAVVGADGAGKSTCVDGLYSWLSKDFAVEKVHLGRPPHSAVTVVVRALVKLRLGLAALARRSSTRQTVESRRRSGARALAEVATARDRYLTYRSARRLSGNGTIVICDRFPLPQLALMDAPQIHHYTLATGGGWLGRRLASLEQRYYRALTLPDLLIVLRVDPEIAVTRKPDEPPDFVRARWREIWEIDWEAVPAYVVDAGRSIPDVLSEVKAHIWSDL
jgi:thymidylate kinase